MGDLTNVPTPEIVNMCKKMFYGGFAFLPLLWIVNIIYVYPEMKVRPELRPLVGKYLLISGIGAFLFAIGYFTWMIYYDVHRLSFGIVGDQLAITVPRGA